jgi:class 3 adenylate cyclase/predicted ATPase
MPSFAQWLSDNGLGVYAGVFSENTIDFDVVRSLSETDLRELGLTLGDRKRLSQAIAKLDAEKHTALTVTPPTSQEIAPKASAAVPESPTGERRQLTVMFCDLVGSTALSEKLDPEELRSLLHNYRTVCGEVIARYEGFVARYVGDGILTYFGWPKAHEEDPERALRAALEIVHAVKDASVTDPLSVRIGIATGPVVVGEQAGVGDQSKLAIGSTPNLAARLQGLAASDQIVIASSTRRLVGNAFELLDLGEHELKGISEPVHAWRVMAVSAAASRFEASHGAQLTPMIGRDQQVGLLLERWELARSGEGQVVLLSGEPGIGKSRMLRAFRERLGEGVEVALQYQCSPYYTNTALYPVIDHLERSLDLRRDDSDEQKLDKLEQRVINQLGRAKLDCSLIARMLSIACDDRYGPLEMSPQRQKDETLSSLVNMMAAVAKSKASVVLFEDAHWADPTTLEALNVLVDRVDSLPLLVLITYRPEFQPPWTRSHVAPITLTRLSRAQSVSIVLRVVGGKPLPADLVTQIVDKTDGVPLFLEELTKAVLESGMVLDVGERYDYSGSVGKMAIPATLHDSLMARLDRLIPVKEIAQIGAALGREFSYELLSAVSLMKEPQLSEALDRLVDSELVFRRGAPPQQTYVFKHALVQDAAYESMLKVKRQALHAQIADAIQQRFPHKVETEPELLAHHYTGAGMPAQAVPLWYQAGQRALGRVALPESAAHLNTALRVNAELPPSSERDRQELDIRLLLGTVYQFYLGWVATQILQALEPARELAIRLGEHDKLVPALWLMCEHNCGRADYSKARENIREIDEIARGTNSRDHYMVARWAESMMLCALGEFQEASRQTDELLAIYDENQHREFANVYNHDPKCGTLLWTQWAYWALGYPEKARRAAVEQAELARRLGHAFNLCWCLTGGNGVLLLLGETELALRWGAEAAAIARDNAMGYMADIIVPWFGEGHPMIEQGNYADGYPKAERGTAHWESMGGIWNLPYNKLILARALVEMGRVEEALATLLETLNVTQRTGHRMHQAELYRVLGEARLRQSVPDHDEAEAAFSKALESARAQSAKGFELRAAMSLARLWQRQGKRREAHDLVAPVYNWFTEGFGTKDLLEAKALLEELA